VIGLGGVGSGVVVGLTIGGGVGLGGGVVW